MGAVTSAEHSPRSIASTASSIAFRAMRPYSAGLHTAGAQGTKKLGIPGEENLDVVESLRRSRIALVLTRHEQAAAFMAATHGRLTGRPGVCLTTLGPGALNLTTGAAYAHLGAMPMIMITGQKPILNSCGP